MSQVSINASVNEKTKDSSKGATGEDSNKKNREGFEKMSLKEEGRGGWSNSE